MSLVSPRPALHNQDDLVFLRTEVGVHSLLPGITGLAQINGRDNLSIQEKVEFDLNYLKEKSFRFDIYIIWLTALKVLKELISHIDLYLKDEFKKTLISTSRFNKKLIVLLTDFICLALSSLLA